MTPRAERLERVRSGTTWDVVVIGGGATGLGTALDSASRGYRTLLLDDHAGTALNAVRVEGLVKNPAGRVSGLKARDMETGEPFEVAARVVVNATGVFADEVRRLDEPSGAAMIAPSQGAHLVLDRR